MTTQIVKFLPQLRCKPSPNIIVVIQGNTNKISSIKYENDYEFTKLVVFCLGVGEKMTILMPLTKRSQNYSLPFIEEM